MEESVYISTPDHVELKFEFAGLGSRFAAYLIDFLFLLLLMLLVRVVALLAGVVSSTSLKVFSRANRVGPPPGESPFSSFSSS